MSPQIPKANTKINTTSDSHIHPKMEYQQSPARNRPPKKPRDERLRSCFDITPSEENDSLYIVCRYCDEYTKNVMKFNPTVSRMHLVLHCPGVGEELRRTLMEGSQEFKRLKRLGDTGHAVGNTTDQTAENAAANNAVMGGNALDDHTDGGSTLARHTGLKRKQMEMTEYTRSQVNQDKRTNERHWLDMWRDLSQEISRLRKEKKDETDLNVVVELESDINGLKKKKAQFARLLGMGGN